MLNTRRVAISEEIAELIQNEVALAAHEVSEIAPLEVVLRLKLSKYFSEIFKLGSSNLVVFSLAPFYRCPRLCRHRKKIWNQWMKISNFFHGLESLSYLCPFALMSETHALSFILYPLFCASQVNPVLHLVQCIV